MISLLVKLANEYNKFFKNYQFITEIVKSEMQQPAITYIEEISLLFSIYIGMVVSLNIKSQRDLLSFIFDNLLPIFNLEFKLEDENLIASKLHDNTFFFNLIPKQFDYLSRRFFAYSEYYSEEILEKIMLMEFYLKLHRLSFKRVLFILDETNVGRILPL